MPNRYNKILCSIASDTALPEDVIVNTFHMRHMDTAPGTTPEDTANDMVDQLEVFYQGIDEILSAEVGTTVVAKVYNIEDPEPRVPILERTIDIVPSATPGFPHENAIVLSMSATVPSGQPRGRYRGRVYLGPIYNGGSSTSGGRVLVAAVATGVIEAAATDAFDTGLVAADPELCVYSRTADLGGASVADSFRPVTLMWVDNAWDTQRRRGQAPTIRTNIPITR